MADFYAPQNPGLAAFIQPYLSWRERQANESRLADLMLPKAIPDYLAGLAYGTNPREPPLTSWRSTLAYGLPAVEALGIAPALRPAAMGGLAAYGALERRLIPPAGQLNMMMGTGGGGGSKFMNPQRFVRGEKRYLLDMLDNLGIKVKESTLDNLSALGVDIGDATTGRFNISGDPRGGWNLVQVRSAGAEDFTPYINPNPPLKYDVDPEVLRNFLNNPNNSPPIRQSYIYPDPPPEYMGPHGLPRGVNAPPARYDVILNQADPAVRAMITEQLKLQGLRDVQITDGVIRDEIARRNAVTMMGLPAENTAADRAAALGFDTPAYHGQSNWLIENKGEIKNIKRGAGSQEGGALYASEGKNTANTYAGTKGAIYPVYARKNDLLESGYPLPSNKEIDRMTPEEVNNLFKDIRIWNKNVDKIRYFEEELKKADNLGKSGVVFKEFYDPAYHSYENPLNFYNDNIYALQGPVRSRFAAFDPARAKEADILAGIAGLSLIPALTLQDYFRQGQ